MPRPTSSDVHVNRPLTNISIMYAQDEANFVADRVFPLVPVEKQSDRYFTYDRGDFNRDEAQERAPSTESAGGGYDLDNTPTYFCKVWAWHKDIDDQIRANADDPLEPDEEATRFVTHKLLIRRERSFVQRFMAGGVWDYDQDGVAASPGANEFIQWSDYTNSDPITDIRSGITAVQRSTGFRPNVITLGRDVFDKLVDHPDIIDRIKYGQTAGGPAIVNRQTMAALFEVEEVLVMDAVYNTAKQGATDSHEFIGGKTALAAYRPASPGLMTPSAGYTFGWRGFTGSVNGQRIKRFRMDHLDSDRVEGEAAFDQKLVGAALGAFWDSAVA